MSLNSIYLSCFYIYVVQKYINQQGKTILQMNDFTQHPTEMNSLTQRECQIIQFLAMGYSAKEIAESNYISFNTVRTHIRNVYEKTGAANLADITRFYFTRNFPKTMHISPRVKFILVMFFLVVSCRIAIQTNTDIIRTRTAKTQTAARRSRKEAYQLSC